MVRIMHNKWFSTVWEFNWRLTQLNWLVDDRLIWEVEKSIEDCHTRACHRRSAQAMGVTGRGRRWADGRGFNFATLSRCDEGSYQNKDLTTGVSPDPFLSPLPTLRLILALSSSGAEVSQILLRIYRELKPSVDWLEHTTYLAAKEFFQSALHRAGWLLRQSTMSITGASGSAAGYNLVKRLVNFFVKIMILLVYVNNMIDMFYLRDNICHVLLVSTMIFFMMII
jgi:hypothetical protein